jgi:hypothetical protein
MPKPRTERPVQRHPARALHDRRDRQVCERQPLPDEVGPCGEVGVERGEAAELVFGEGCVGLCGSMLVYAWILGEEGGLVCGRVGIP